MTINDFCLLRLTTDHYCILIISIASFTISTGSWQLLS